MNSEVTLSLMFLVICLERILVQPWQMRIKLCISFCLTVLGNNSAAMLKRLKDHAKSVWGDEDLPCISLATGASAMHKLWPQPSWDRTCTAAAAAAIGLLSELSLLPQLSPSSRRSSTHTNRTTLKNGQVHNS